MPDTTSSFDAVVVGAGPNGLAAAIEMARAGLAVLIREASPEVGGGAKTLELTLPGFVHDPFSAIHPMGAGSPFLSRLPLEAYGLEWTRSPSVVAHPLDDGSAVVLEQDLDETVRGLGSGAKRYAGLLRPFVHNWESLSEDILAPLGPPRHPLLMARFGISAIRSADGLWGGRHEENRASALLTGSAAHAGLPLDTPASAAFGLALHAAGHAVGWPFPRGGSGRLTAAMADYFLSLGGTIETDAPVEDFRDLPGRRVTLLDLTPRQILRLRSSPLPARYADRLKRFKYGVGVFKMDWALSGPVPWRAAECRRAATVHIGGRMAEIRSAFRAVARGSRTDRPFVIFAQPSLFDPTRAPAGAHTAWAYCHVPNGSDWDMSDAIRSQIERFAPGFQDLILSERVLRPADLERMNGNLVGGDLNGGWSGLPQLFFRPVVSPRPYDTPVEGVFICSASTPPGGGVHGMCGFHAARRALASLGIPPATL